jgi:Ca2+-transporting ATPase
MVHYYAEKVEKVLDALNTSSDKGLSSREAKARLEKYGHNELQKEKGITALQIFLNQFKNALIILLVFAAILSLFLGEALDSVAMFGIIALTAVLGFIQEYRAEKAVEELQKISAPTAKVLRNGKTTRIPAKDLVPGDILLLEAGDIIAADSRLVEVSSLQIDESSLTGESVPSKKVIDPFKHGTSVADQENMAFMSSIVTYGKGKSVVTNTGMKTELGKIATSIQTTKEVQTPLQKKFGQMAKQIGMAVIVLIIIIFTIGFFRGEATLSKMLIFALSLTVAAVPNSLPVIVTVGLSMGTKRLSKRHMLIKKLPAAESLGSVTMICSDKTGTLTKNQMTITEIYTDHKKIDVSGSGYEPKGNFSINNKPINQKKLELLLRIGYLCNNAKLVEKKSRYEIIGDPTEGSLIVLGKKGKLSEVDLKKHFKFIEELPFDSDRKRMTVIYKNKQNKKTEAYAKGAPDLLLEKCDRILENGRVRFLSRKDKRQILKMNNDFAGKALRVLGLAYRDLPSTTKKYTLDTVEKNLTFVGLVGMIDPPRPEVKKSIAECKEAGIDVMVITGDQALTTKAVAEQIGLFKKGDIILTGDEVEKMSDKELEAKIEKVRIIARALPIQKSRVVDALKKKGHQVAMTGDGVNDAPALKKADIGIAMGITGTDVAKEVSKAILVDDNFSTIVNAISEGRNIYDKMIKSVRYLLSCNAGEIVAVFTAIMLKFPLPMIPLQILLMNLLTDDFPALGLGAEPSEEGVMKRPPRDPKQKPITKNMLILILIFGLIMGLGTFFMFTRYADGNLVKAQTVAFTTLVAFEMLAVLSSRSLYHSWKKLNPLTNLWLMGAIGLSILIQIIIIYWAPLQPIFGTFPLTLIDWLKIIGIAFVGFIVMESSKFFLKIKSFSKA